MKGITKLTYENGWIIGLGVYEKQYYIFWGKTGTSLSLMIDNEGITFDNVICHDIYIKIPFFKDKDKYFTMMRLNKQEDFEVAEKILKAVLIDE